MYSQNHAAMAPPQKPETFMLSNEAQQSLPQDAQVALQQVDNCKSYLELAVSARVLLHVTGGIAVETHHAGKQHH